MADFKDKKDRITLSDEDSAYLAALGRRRIAAPVVALCLGEAQLLASFFVTDPALAQGLALSAPLLMAASLAALISGLFERSSARKKLASGQPMARLYSRIEWRRAAWLCDLGALLFYLSLVVCAVMAMDGSPIDGNDSLALSAALALAFVALVLRTALVIVGRRIKSRPTDKSADNDENDNGRNEQ